MRTTILFIFFAAAIVACKHPEETKQEQLAEEVRQTMLTKNKVMVNDVPQKITFPSIDSLPVHANLYHVDDKLPVIVLCHQARFNKVEYIKSAETLNELGFNCLAIDQRSGGVLLEWFNETNQEAEKLDKPTEYLDAQQDIIAAVEFAAEKYKKPVILVGSSYSSTLALNIAAENKNVKAVVGFSPGNYFLEAFDLTKKLPKFKKPMLVTSSKEEAPALTQMLSEMDMNDMQTQYIPEAEGVHGARALWKTYEDNEEYWTALINFLEKVKE